MQKWVLVESDFRREYHIDLVSCFWDMSWRQFINYVAGLSKDSVFFAWLSSDTKREYIDDNPEDVAASIISMRKKSKTT